VAKININPLVVVAIIVIGVFFFLNQGNVPVPEAQATLPVGTLEDNLKQDYNTVWADVTDEQFTSTGANEFNGRILNAFGNVRTSTNSISLSGTVVDDRETPSTVTTVQTFKGQEVVMIVQGSGDCNILPSQFDPVGGLLDDNPIVMRYVSNPFDTSRYNIHQDGVKVRSNVNIGDGFNLGVSCNKPGKGATIHYIGQRAEFRCDLSSDEVWITDDFASAFNVEDVIDRGFIPSKYCQTRPFVLRDVSQGERLLEREFGIDLLNTGGTIPVQSGQVVTVNYAAFFVEGVLNPTGPNEANVCIERSFSGECTNWGVQDFVTPTEVIITSCSSDSDCPQPLRDACSAYFVGCESNICVYDDTLSNAPQCKNELVTIVKDIEKIKEREIIFVSGDNVFVFDVAYPFDSFDIGVKEFKAEIDFTCSIAEGDIVSFPNPNVDCYKGKATYNGKIFNLLDGDNIQLEDNINVTFLAGGTVALGDKDGLSSQFVFVISNPMNITIEDTSEILFEADKKAVYTVTNNMPSGTILLKQSQVAKQTNRILPERQVEILAISGKNNIPVTLNTSNLGIQEVIGQAFYKLVVNDKEILLPSDKIKVNYDVVSEFSSLSTDIKIITVEKEVFVQLPEREGVSPVLIVIFSLVGLFVLLKALRVI